MREKPALVVLAALTLVVSPGAYAQQNAAIPRVSMIELDGRTVRVQAIGLQDRRPGQPVVVFEAGATNSLEVWGGILRQVASMAPVVAYDRAGLGRSEWDDTSPTPKHVADSLRRVLRQIGADPPYVLIGYSWGGMLARYFGGYYPSDVVGFVFVDPGPLVTESLADNLMPFEAIGAGRAGFESYVSTNGSWPLLMAPWTWRTAPLTPFLERIRASSCRPSSGCWEPCADSRFPRWRTGATL